MRRRNDSTDFDVMRELTKGHFVEHDGLIAVVVGTFEDGWAPKDHLMLWYGDPRCTRVSQEGLGDQQPEVWIVPTELCVPAKPFVVKH